MALSLGPRNVRDDRGNVVTGRTVNELLGDARVEAGKRRWSWRMIGAAGLWTAAMYLLFGRSVARAFSQGGFDAWLFGTIFVIVVVWTVSGIIKSVRSKNANHPDLPKPAELSAVTALTKSGRCGACGYVLDASRAEPDGCTLCSECGAAWHASRIAPTRPTAASVADSIEDSLRTHDRPLASRDADDRFQPTAIANHNGRADGQPPASAAGRATLHAYRRHVVTRRLTLFGIVATLGVALVVTGFALMHHNKDTGVELAIVGFVCVVASLAMFGITSQWTVRRQFFLDHRTCPTCLDTLHGPVTFDGCVVCGTCGHAWSAHSLGWKAAMLTDATSQAPSPPPTPPSPDQHPHCAACRTALEGPNRVCPSCHHQAGIVYL